MIKVINDIDHAVIFFIQEYLRSDFMDPIMVFITSLGDRGIFWILVSLFLLINKKTRKAGILTLAALLLNQILGEGILKNIIRRERPYTTFSDITLLIKALSSYSFPSGHTSSSFAAAYVLSRYLGRYGFLFWGIAVLMGFSRIYLFVHYPSDVLGGVLLGLLSGSIIVFVYQYISEKRKYDRKREKS